MKLAIRTIPQYAVLAGIVALILVLCTLIIYPWLSEWYYIDIRGSHYRQALGFNTAILDGYGHAVYFKSIHEGAALYKAGLRSGDVPLLDESGQYYTEELWFYGVLDHNKGKSYIIRYISNDEFKSQLSEILAGHSNPKQAAVIIPE